MLSDEHIKERIRDADLKASPYMRAEEFTFKVAKALVAEATKRCMAECTRRKEEFLRNGLNYQLDSEYWNNLASGAEACEKAIDEFKGK